MLGQGGVGNGVTSPGALKAARGGGAKGTQVLLQVLTGERVTFGIFVGAKKQKDGSNKDLTIIHIREIYYRIN